MVGASWVHVTLWLMAPPQRESLPWRVRLVATRPELTTDTTQIAICLHACCAPHTLGTQYTCTEHVVSLARQKGPKLPQTGRLVTSVTVLQQPLAPLEISRAGRNLCVCLSCQLQSLRVRFSHSD